MPNTKADYFLEELTDWKNAIGLYQEEMLAFTGRFEAVVARNSIPHIAERVERYQERLNQLALLFQQLQNIIEQQQTLLITDHTPVDNTQIRHQTTEQQQLLRHEMLVAEQTYVNLKFDCYDFLAGVLKP